jgi:hypothetical protein
MSETKESPLSCISTLVTTFTLAAMSKNKVKSEPSAHPLISTGVEKLLTPWKVSREAITIGVLVMLFLSMLAYESRSPAEPRLPGAPAVSGPQELLKLTHQTARYELLKAEARVSTKLRPLFHAKRLAT